MNFKFCSRCCNMTPHTDNECDFCYPPNSREESQQRTPQEAKERVAIKRQLREYNLPFDNDDSTESLEKQLALADFLHNFGNAIAVVHLKAQNDKPITLEHIQKLCDLYEKFRDVMLSKQDS
jgi:hypothetical protein